MDALPRMALADWKAKARAGEAPHALLHKQYIADSVKAEDGDSRKVEFTISTGAVDRDRDTLKADGWRLEQYRKNPVVLWAHQSRELPIGKAEAIRVTGGALKARAEFISAEDYPFADTVYRLLRGGFLKATSVGFIPEFDKAAWNEARGGFDFDGQELLEFSVVPVPANPEALADAKAAGIDLAPLKGWAEKTLDELSDEPGLWVPKAQAEAALKVLGAPRVVVPDIGRVLDFGIAMGKRGRVLSAANEQRLRTARDSGVDLCHALDDVLSQVVAEEEQAAAVPSEKDEEPYVMVLVDPEPKAVESPEPSLALDPKVLEAVITASVRDTVAAEFRRAAGRLD